MNGNKPQQITFFSRFEADILSGKKTITIRDQSESHFQPNQILSVATYEENRFFTYIKVIAVSPIHFDDLNERHAQQENMSLAELRRVIRDIYPNETQFWIIEFEKIAAETLSKSE